MDISNDFIRVSGARTHNLKNVDVDIPKNKLVVITGLSGSGKSSLAIDTIYAEGQRQYIESLSLFSRQFFNQSTSIDVDAIEGLQPTICINQQRGSPNPRSTVATTTEIYDYLRLLYAKTGKIRCPNCDESVAPQTIEQIGSAVQSLPERTKIMVLAPMVSQRVGAHADVLEKIRKERIVRVRINGQLHDIESLPELNARKTHSIDAVTDRIIVKDGIENRLFESLEMASKLSDGAICISYQQQGKEQWEELFFSTKNACLACGESCPHISARTFSFNSPIGACPDCNGLGVVDSFDPELLIPDWNAKIKNAIFPWNSRESAVKTKLINSLSAVAKANEFSLATKVAELNTNQLDNFLNSTDKKAPGLLLLMEKELATCIDEEIQAELETFRNSVKCRQCAGTRLNRYARSVCINETPIYTVCDFPLSTALNWFDNLQFEDDHEIVARPILDEISNRLRFLLTVGLQYLTLSRSADSLSGGELQRVRLAKSIGNGLTGVCYVLDEPSAGLHAEDNQRLIDTIVELKNRANSVIVVEHDENIINVADHLIEIGPGAGTGGGTIIDQGPPASIADNHSSLTGDYLARRKSIQLPRNPLEEEMQAICIRGASGFNLQNVDVEIPIGKLTCISGVSGSGKTTLLYRTLAPAIKQHFGLSTEPPLPHDSISGLEAIERIVEIDQRPIGRTPRGCAATYTGILDDIRKIFAATKKAKQMGFTASRFSFNSKPGRCNECEGHGKRKISMKFMPDVLVDCPTCHGKRYNTKTRSVTFAGMSIADVLDLSIDQAIVRFENFTSIAQRLGFLQQVGLGYLTLGQPATSLSGGEAQRIKLATELSKSVRGKTLFLMDEPTTGLHFHDVQMLLNVLGALVDAGNTIVVIEHNVDVIKCADFVIDVGPGAGAQGGKVVASGTPRQLAQSPESITGRWIKS